MPKPIDSVSRAAVLKLYQGVNFLHGSHEFEVWVETVSSVTGLTVPQVKRIIAEEAASYLHSVRSHATTSAQKIAQTMGLTIARVIGVINEAMEAEEVTFLKDRHGDPVKDEGGNHIEVRNPLWGIRLKAAGEGAKVLGAYAPQQIEVAHEVRFESMSDEELLRQADEYERSISRLKAELAESSGAAKRAAARADGTSSAGGSLLLADGVHEDIRRAGSDQPVQTLPQG